MERGRIRKERIHNSAKWESRLSKTDWHITWKCSFSEVKDRCEWELDCSMLM